MKLSQILTGRNKNRQSRKPRSLRLEQLQNRELMAGDLCGPQPLPAENNGPVVEFNFGDVSIIDDIKRAVAGVPDINLEFVSDPIANHATEIVNGGQAAARTGDAATEVVNGGQDAARAGGAATEVVDGGQAAARAGDAATELVDGGQAAARTGSAATEVVNGGQDALRATAGRWDHLPTFIKTPEYGAAHSAHMTAVSAGDTGEAIRTHNQMRSLEVLEYPDGRQVYYRSGENYVPTNQIDDAVELCGDSCSAGRRIVGQAIGAVATVADFVVDPVLGTIFYDENLKTGEKVFGEDTYCSEVYANLQCVPALGGPLADVTACIYTACTTDWGTYFFGSDDVPTPAQASAAVKRYQDLENRKDYDANHGNKHQEYLWKKVQAAKAELRAMGINPAAVR